MKKFNYSILTDTKSDEEDKALNSKFMKTSVIFRKTFDNIKIYSEDDDLITIDSERELVIVSQGVDIDVVKKFIPEGIIVDLRDYDDLENKIMRLLFSYGKSGMALIVKDKGHRSGYDSVILTALTESLMKEVPVAYLDDRTPCTQEESFIREWIEEEIVRQQKLLNMYANAPVEGYVPSSSMDAGDIVFISEYNGSNGFAAIQSIGITWQRFTIKCDDINFPAPAGPIPTDAVKVICVKNSGAQYSSL